MKNAPWNMMQGESSVAFAAFVTYRDLGPQRSVYKAAQILGKTDSTLREWQSKFEWVERSRAWDAHIDEQRQREIEKESVKMARRQAQQAQALAQLAVLPIQRLIKKLSEDKEYLAKFNQQVDSMSANDVIGTIARIIPGWATAVKTERLARGEVTERTDQNITGGQVIGVTQDPVLLRQLMDKADTRAALQKIAEASIELLETEATVSELPAAAVEEENKGN